MACRFCWICALLATLMALAFLSLAQPREAMAAVSHFPALLAS